MQVALKMNQPLKILMLLHMPWSRNLGGARVQLELADEFEALGHQIEKFDFYDAFPHYKKSPIGEVIRSSFAAKAKKYVQANSHRFDVIDAHQGNLPFSKSELGFRGLLVARSVGLYAFYDQLLKQEDAKCSSGKLKTHIGRRLRLLRANREYPDYLQSFQSCDLINVPNCDELKYVRDELKLGHKCTVLPFGLSRQRQKSFLNAIKPASERLKNKTVVFIGNWGIRKGAKDWENIIKYTKSEVPDVRFLFLGTGVDAEIVLADLNLQGCEWIKVIPSYESEELPKLLSDATIGAFPSYMEGFGFAVLEKLACGIPTVAYDVPGPREMLKHLDSSFMIPVGRTDQFSHQLIQLLKLEIDRYSKLTEQCIEIASKFSWNAIAHKTLESYFSALDQ